MEQVKQKESRPQQQQQQQQEQHPQQPQQQKQPAAKRKKRQLITASTVTFTELRKILQEMRPYTLQVLRTPYYRNCKAARNMRRDMRQMRDLCKQVRIETVLLGKRNKAEGTGRRQKRPVKQPTASVTVDDNADSSAEATILVSKISDGVRGDLQAEPSYVILPSELSLPVGANSPRLGPTTPQQPVKAEDF